MILYLLLLLFIHSFTFLFIPFTRAVPLERDADLESGKLNRPGEARLNRVVVDIEILNFGLTMEHLISEAYRGGLAQYSNQDFENAGFESFTHGRLSEIADHEDDHVEILKAAVSGAMAQPAPKCEYNL